MEVEESRNSYVTVKKEQSHSHHKEKDKEREREQRYEKEMQCCGNVTIDENNNDICNNILWEEEEEEREAATPHEPETELLDASTPSREVRSNNSYHTTKENVVKEENHNYTNVNVARSSFTSLPLMEERSEEQERKEEEEQQSTAEILCNVFSVFNQSPYISPPRMELEENKKEDNDIVISNTSTALPVVENEEFRHTPETGLLLQHSIYLSHPVVEFLSSIQLQGFAYHIIWEHQIHSLKELSDYMSAQAKARELLGERSSMHQRRELWKGVEQLRRNWEKEATCKQIAAKKRQNTEIKQRKLLHVQAKRKGTKTQKLCSSNDGSLDQQHNVEPITAAHNVPIEDKDTLDVICNRLISSQKKETLESVLVKEKEKEKEEEMEINCAQETTCANTKESCTRAAQVTTFMSEMKFKRCNRPRKRRSARGSKAELPFQHLHNTITTRNSKEEEADTCVNDKEHIEAVLQAAIAEAEIYKTSAKPTTIKSQSQHQDVIVISDSDDDEDSNYINRCTSAKESNQMSKTIHSFNSNRNELSKDDFLRKSVLRENRKEEKELEEEEKFSAQKELMYKINVLLCEYNAKLKTLHDSNVKRKCCNQTYPLRAVLHPLIENGQEETPLVSLYFQDNKKLTLNNDDDVAGDDDMELNKTEDYTISSSNEIGKRNNDANYANKKCSSEGTKAGRDNNESDNESDCEKSNPCRWSIGDKVLELFGLEALEPTQPLNEKEDTIMMIEEEEHVCPLEDSNVNEYERASSLEFTQSISPIYACDESHSINNGDDASLPASPLSHSLDFLHLQHNSNEEATWQEQEQKSMLEKEKNCIEQRGEVCVANVDGNVTDHSFINVNRLQLNAEVQLTDNNATSSEEHVLEYEEEEFEEEELLHWNEHPEAIEKMSKMELINKYNQFVKCSKNIEVDTVKELSEEQREEMEEALRLHAVRAAFSRIVAPAMLHRSKRISQLAYKRLRTADYTKLVMEKMRCTELSNSINIDNDQECCRNENFDETLLKQKICEEEYNEVGKCVFATLATETVEKLESVCNTCEKNESSCINSNSTCKREKYELTSLDKILLLEPVQFDQIMNCVQQNDFTFVPQLKLRRLLDDSGVPLTNAVDLTQLSDLPSQTSQPLESEKEKESQKHELLRQEAGEITHNVKRVKNTSSQIYFARRQQHSYYPTTRVAGRRVLRTRRKRE